MPVLFATRGAYPKNLVQGSTFFLGGGNIFLWSAPIIWLLIPPIIFLWVVVYFGVLWSPPTMGLLHAGVPTPSTKCKQRATGASAPWVLPLPGLCLCPYNFCNLNCSCVFVPVSPNWTISCLRRTGGDGGGWRGAEGLNANK